MTRVLICVILVGVVAPVWAQEAQRHVEMPMVDISGSPNGVVALPADMPQELKVVFVKYTKVVAPNGQPIHIVAQDGWSEARIVKARKVLEHILTDAPGTQYGSDKTIVANTMADNRATLVLFNTVEDLEKALDSGLREIDLGMQDLRANECPIEGSDDYMNHVTRDASYEEIIHMVHDYGIKRALPEYQKELRVANDAATKRGIWRGWPDDEPENHPNEYLGVIYDNYLDLWWPNPTKYEGEQIETGQIPEGQSHFGRFHINSRARLGSKDPVGYGLVEKFFQPYLTYAPELPAEFDGTFSIELDQSQRYTHKSQHLKDVTLAGKKDSNLVGNGRDNRLTGNGGNNILIGNSGNDLLNGGGGVDTAVFAGARDEYEVVRSADHVRVVDTRVSRDGQDILIDIEKLQFSDGSVSSR